MNALTTFKPEAVTVGDTSLRIFDRVPGRCLAFAVLDGSCMPLVQPGEVLIVDDAPRMVPVEGQWFLLQWISPPRNEWERQRVTQTVGVPRELKPDLWGYGPPCNSHGGMTYCGDFGFNWQQMTDYIRGPVIGLYRPGAMA